MTAAQLTNAIPLPDGSWIRGRGLHHPRPVGALPVYGLYLGTRILRDRHDHELSWPHDWVTWPDFLLPVDRTDAIRHIRALHARSLAGERVEVACNGGIGRTGTVIACLAVLAGLPAADAVAWTRANHHHRAVETPWQRRWVRRFLID